MTVGSGDPRIDAFFVHPSGKSYGRLEEERIMPLILRDLPADIDSLIYVGTGGDEGLPKYLEPWKAVIRTLDINPYCKPDIVADIRDTKLPEDSFDAVVLIAVLEHIFEKEKVVEECYRILRPQGTIILGVPWVFPYHAGGEGDYWRISKDGLGRMLAPLFTEVQTASTWWATYGWAKK